MFKLKYLKYKQKYINLKKNLIGGRINNNNLNNNNVQIQFKNKDELLENLENHIFVDEQYSSNYENKIWDNNNQGKFIKFNIDFKIKNNSETDNKNIIFNFIDLSGNGDDLNTDYVELSFHREAFTNDSQQIINLLYNQAGIILQTV